MSEETIFIGIIDDDEESTNKVTSILENNAKDRSIDIEVNFFEATRNETKVEKGHDLANTVEELLDGLEKFFSKKNNPKILLIDFKLSATIAPYGSSLALRLKEEQESQPFLKDLPIVGTSNFIESNQLTEHRELEFIDIFDKEQLDRQSQSIFQIALDFPKLNELSDLDDEERKDQLMSLINLSDDSKEVFWNALPSEFKKDWDIDTPQSLARWIWKVFLEKPGLLLNELYAATLIGIKIDAFQKIKSQFDQAVYDGIFSVKNKVLWWKEKLINILEKEVEETKIMPIWKRGHSINEITPEDKAKCQITGETETKMIPAYIDEGRDKLTPITYDLTKEDPKDNISVGFDSVRIFKEI